MGRFTSHVLPYRAVRKDKHNNFAERIPVIEQKVKVCEHRLDDLEEGDKNG